jgi:hypothetical protein
MKEEELESIKIATANGTAHVLSMSVAIAILFGVFAIIVNAIDEPAAFIPAAVIVGLILLAGRPSAA